MQDAIAASVQGTHGMNGDDQEAVILIAKEMVNRYFSQS